MSESNLADAVELLAAVDGAEGLPERATESQETPADGRSPQKR